MLTDVHFEWNEIDQRKIWGGAEGVEKREKIIQYKNETLSNKSHDSITMVKNVKNGYLLWLKMCVKMAYEVSILREDVK